MLRSQRDGMFVGGGVGYPVQISSYEHAIGAYAISEAYGLTSIPFLKAAMEDAVQVIIDGQNEHAIKDQLSMEIQNLQARHAEGKKMLEFMGSGCPAFGMVGTLIGLVQMFR